MFGSRMCAGAYAALALLLSPHLCIADSAQEPADPPSAVGRIAEVAGGVAYRETLDQAPSAATLNYPLTMGNVVAPLPRAHATIDIGAGRFYLDGDSEISIGALATGTAEVALRRGALILHILPGGEGQVFTVQTADGAMRADQPGDFEIIAAADGQPTTIAAMEQGGAQFRDRAGAEHPLQPGQQLTIAGGAVKIDPVVEDDFVRRVADDVQSTGENQLAAPKYVSASATGFEDLARYGLWELTQEYGPVWEPQVMSQWAPYRNGHWTKIAPWGLTWIDDAPWGFTPFHYGRWIQIDDRWAWVPGDAARAPVYAPALVSFFGMPKEKDGNVGWVPLGPEEPYLPPYPVTFAYVRAINEPSVPQIVNITNVTNITQVTNVVQVVHQRPFLVIGRLVNRHHATMTGGGVVTYGHEVAGSYVNLSVPELEERESKASSNGLVTIGPATTRANASLQKSQSSIAVANAPAAAGAPAKPWLPAIVLSKPGPLPPQFRNVPESTARPLVPAASAPAVIYRSTPTFTVGAPAAMSLQPTQRQNAGKTVATTTPQTTPPAAGGASLGSGNSLGMLGNPAPRPAIQHCTPTVGIACIIGQ